MMTSVVSSSVQAGLKGVRTVARMCRKHTRIVISSLIITLMLIVSYLPSRVESAPVVLDAPTLQVTQVSDTSIKLQWTPVPGVTEYQIARSESMSGPFRERDIVNSNTLTYTDSQPGITHKSFFYRVHAIDASETPTVLSAPSKMALGTAITFEFDELDEKTITARHLDDLRVAVNAVRKLANLPKAVWPQGNLNGQEVKAADIDEIRARLFEARTALKMTKTITDPILKIGGSDGVTVKATHIEELQFQATRGVSSSNVPLYLISNKDVGGEFGAPIDLTTVPVHLSVLPNKQILFWGRDMMRNNAGRLKQRSKGSAAYLWDMTQPLFQFTFVPNDRTNLFCSGHTFLPNGDLFVTGGHRSAHFDGAGEAHTNIFRRLGNFWVNGPNMNHRRWYPYNVTLSTGEPLIMAGSYWVNENTMGVDPYDPNDAPVPDPSPSPWPVVVADTLAPEVYTPAQGGAIREMPEPPDKRLPPYPYLHLLANGRVFQAQSGFKGSQQVDHLTRLFDPKTKTWPTDPKLKETVYPHATGSSVLLSDGTVLLIGGVDNSNTPTEIAESIKPTATPSPSPNSPLGWSKRESMKIPRTHHTATLLPDGKVLVTGGVSCRGFNNIATFDDGIPECSGGEARAPELYNPQDDTWTTMNAHSQVRGYHSVAALLPDGRVLVGGGGFPGAIGEVDDEGDVIMNFTDDSARLFGHKNVEIFSPPYLFDANGDLATRPQITSTPPASVTYGEQFTINTSNTGSQPTVSFVRLPSVTHGNNQDQRVVPVNPELVANGIRITVPSSSAELPPGYYMMFVLNGSVPSVAAIIRVQNSSLFASETPLTTASGNNQTWEQGMEFSSTVSGQITHVRFWKAVGETSGNHVARIWSTSGLPLATASFTGETASGWQTAMLQTPLDITAHTKYRVSYNIHTVRARSENIFAVPVTSGQLVAWSSFLVSPAGSFPSTPSTDNFFVDVVFK